MREVIVLATAAALCACGGQKVLLTKDELAQVRPSEAVGSMWAQPDGAFEVVGGMRERVGPCASGETPMSRVARDKLPLFEASAKAMGADGVFLYLPDSATCNDGWVSAYSFRRTDVADRCETGKEPGCKLLAFCPADSIRRDLWKTFEATVPECLSMARAGRVLVRFEIGLFGEVLYPRVVDDTTGIPGAARCVTEVLATRHFEEPDGGLCRVEATFLNPAASIGPR